MREAADECAAVIRLEFMKLAGVDEACDHFVHIIGRADIVGNNAVKLFAIIFRRSGLLKWNFEALVVAEMADDVANDRQRMFVILGQMIDDTRLFRVQVAPPRSSALISSPVAAFTSGGPARRRSCPDCAR